MPKGLSEAEVSLFVNSFHNTPSKTLTLLQAVEAIRTGHYERQIQAIRAILRHQGKAAYNRAKARLKAVTFGGTFAPRRGNAHLHQHSGIIHGDIDYLSDVPPLKQAICQDPRTVYAFVSPSGTGLKLGVRASIVADDAGYKHAWQTVSTEYEARYGSRWDPSGKDISRLCFVSYDPALYWNPDAEVFAIPPAPSPKLPPSQRSVSRPSYRHQGYAEQAIRTAVEIVESAELGTRHHTRLKAARLLGGYVAGGLLREDQAYGALAQALIGHTEDLERALKTVVDGLAYGRAHPITLEALEAERQAWLDQQFVRNRLNPVNSNRQQVPEPLVSDPWEGSQTLPARPYTGYTGYRSYRGYRGVTRHG
jgi:BT4734-like, N-terminal domain